MSEPAESDIESEDAADDATRQASGAGARAWGGWVILSALVGVGIGMIWALVAPRAEFRVSGGEFLRVAAQPEEYFLGDLVLGVLLAVAGAVLAGVWWWRGQHQPLASLIGLLTGGIVAMSIAVLVGQGLAGGPVTAEGLADGVIVRAGLEFSSWAMVVWWPTLVAVLFAVALAGSGSGAPTGRGPDGATDPNGDPEEDGPISFDGRSAPSAPTSP